MDERTEKYVERVFKWLDKNVKHYPTPKQVTLFSFEVDWSNLSGSFRLILDDEEIPDELTFGIEQSGKANFYPPMFHSPLGAPASYAAIELTESTKKTILLALTKVVPRVMAFGIYRETGKEIFSDTPMQERIMDKEEFEAYRARVSSPDFSINMEVIR